MRLAAAVLVVMIFIADYFTPSNLAIPVLYSLPIVLLTYTRRTDWVVMTAIVVTGLVYAGYFVSPLDGSPEEAFFNRILALITVWAVVVIAVVSKGMG